MTTLERYRGCLLGLTAGDALGTTRFQTERHAADHIFEGFEGAGRLEFQGEWTDDTKNAGRKSPCEN